MRRMREFVCLGCLTRTEKLVEDGTLAIWCPACEYLPGGPVEAQLTMSTPRIRLEGITGAFPSAYDKWNRDHVEAAKVANKRNEGKYD